MSFIKEENEDVKTEGTWRVKQEDPEEQTKTEFIKEEREDVKIEETFRVKQEDTEEQTASKSTSQALNSATCLLESACSSPASASADTDSCTNQDDDNPEEAETLTCSTAPSHTQRSRRTEKRKRESNVDLLEYFQAADERFMLQTKEMHQDILKRMNDTSASLLGLLGRMVSVMEAEQRKEI